MPAKRQYNVKGTNDFLALACIFFFLCLWAIKDGWFPSEKVLKKHPQQVDVVFASGGAVEKVNVKQGDFVGEDELLANLRSDKVKVLYDESRDTYTAAKTKYSVLEQAFQNLTKSGASSEKVAEVKKNLEMAQSSMNEALANVDDVKSKLDATQLRAPSKGEILKVLVSPHTMVEKGQTAFVIDPKGHFYLFNKSLTVLSFILFWVFLAIHVLAR